MKRLSVFSKTLLVLFLPLFSYSQGVRPGSSTSASSTVSLQLNNFAEFTVTPVNTSPFSFSTITTYENGITRTPYSSFTVKSNVNWAISLKASGSFFAASGGGSANTMPVSIISFKKNNESTYKTLTTANQSLSSGSAGGSQQTGNTFSIDVRVAPGYAYNGGIYTIDLVYTLTGQ
jgi:hypothetical protein